MKTRQYSASCKGPLAPRELNLRAASYEEAAQHAANRFFGRGLTIRRTTGSAGLSGYFQAYRAVPQRLSGGLTSFGDPFHVF
jgi:hypothetical protein